MRLHVARTVVVVTALAMACSEDSRKAGSAFDAAGGLARVKAARAELVRVWDALDAARAELRTLEEKRGANAADAARKTEIEAVVKQSEAAFENAYGADQSTLADFLNQALNIQPQGAETLEALNLYAESAIRNAGELIEYSGDYRRAIELLDTARSYFDAVQAPAPEALATAAAGARDYRFVTQARFDRLKKGLSAAEVKALIGVPFYANIRSSVVGGKEVTSWLYSREDGEVAGVYLDDRGRLYAWKWNVKE